MPGYRITKHSGLFGVFFPCTKAEFKYSRKVRFVSFFFGETIRLLLPFCRKNLHQNKSSVKICIHCVQGTILNKSCNLNCTVVPELRMNYLGANLSPLHNLTANETLITSWVSLAKAQNGVSVFLGALTSGRTKNLSPGFQSPEEQQVKLQWRV